MNQGKYVFSQMTEFLPQRVFDKLVMKYSGNKYVRHFTCWNQLLCMVFGQITNRDSLRDLILAINAHSQKSYHLGFGISVTRSNLSKANEKRNSKIFEEFAYHLIEIGYSCSLTFSFCDLAGIRTQDPSDRSECSTYCVDIKSLIMCNSDKILGFSITTFLLIVL
jgi:hypothetical protein